MVNQVNGSGNVAPSYTVAEAAPRKAPDAAGVRPQAVTARICSQDGYTYIQAISNAFGYREPGMLSKYDLRSSVSGLVTPEPLTGSPKTNRENDDKRTAQIDKLTDETWAQLVDKGYIDANGVIQDKFRNVSSEDFSISFSGGEKAGIPKATQEIYETLKQSDKGEIASNVQSQYVLEKVKAGSGKLPYTDAMLLLSSLQALGYVSSSTPGATEKDTRTNLIEGLTKFQAKHTEIQVSIEDKGNRVGPATIKALVQELKTIK